MDQLPGGLLAPFIEESQRLAQGEVGSFCSHPLHPPRLGLIGWRKLLVQLANSPHRVDRGSIHLGNPGSKVYSASPRRPVTCASISAKCPKPLRSRTCPPRSSLPAMVCL